MAQDIVVKESLDHALIRDGAALVRELDDAKWPVTAALWFYYPDTNAWRLLIASPEVGTKGPLEAYAAVQKALKGLDAAGRVLTLEDIGVVTADHPPIGVLRTALATGPVITQIRFSRNVVGGHYIDDALIYRLT
jgi:hypothetical protein